MEHKKLNMFKDFTFHKMLAMGRDLDFFLKMNSVERLKIPILIYFKINNKLFEYTRSLSLYLTIFAFENESDFTVSHINIIDRWITLDILLFMFYDWLQMIID